MSPEDEEVMTARRADAMAELSSMEVICDSISFYYSHDTDQWSCTMALDLGPGSHYHRGSGEFLEDAFMSAYAALVAAGFHW